MEDRIEINGVYYVREQSDSNPFENIFDQDVVMYENDYHCFTCERSKAEKSLEFIEVWDKGRDRKYIVDNVEWVHGIANGSGSLFHCEDSDRFKREITYVAKDLKKRGWI